MISRFVKQIIANRKTRELEELADLNDYLKKYHLCILQSHLDRKSLKKISKLVRSKSHNPHKEQQILALVGARILNSKYRAYQNSYRYRHLHIFKSFNKVIDFAVLSFFRKNWICCYLTLVQIVQVVLRKWLISINEGDGDYKILFIKIKEKIVLVKEELDEITKDFSVIKKSRIIKTDTIIKTNEGDDYAVLRYYSSLYKYLLLVVRDVFDNDVLSSDILTNRHINNHFRKNPDHFCSEINALRLLIALDIISELYLWKNRADYLMLKTDIKNKSGNKIYKKYHRFYANSFRQNNRNKSPEEILLKTFYS